MADRLLQPFLPSKPFRNGTVATSSVVTKQALSFYEIGSTNEGIDLDSGFGRV